MGRQARSTARGRARAPRSAGIAVSAAAALALASAGAASAGAAERVIVTGAGFGHGVGLSQYGAKGMAEAGISVRRILRHYYRGTSLQRAAAADRAVRVALQWGRRETTVSGAKSIGGIRTKTTRSYRVVRTGAGLDIRQVGRRKKVGTATSTVQIVPGNATTLRVAGRAADGVQDGSFRGTIDVLPDGGSVLVVNELDMEDYLRGVVTEESPANWPSAALQAQAIVARTYAVTNAVGGRAFDQWPDTRSQVYTGISGESGPGDAAIAATDGQVVTLGGTPVITYFFSTSGGRTEDAENVFGGEPRSWLQGVDDPYDGRAGAELHRWTRTFSTASADDRTKRFGVGALRRIEILDRGVSPRVTRARVVGDAGTKVIDGGQLQRAFDLPDRWMTFANVSMSGCLKPPPTAAERRAVVARREARKARREAARVRAELRRRAKDPRTLDAGLGLGVSVTVSPGEDGTTRTPRAPAGAPTPAGPASGGAAATTGAGATLAAATGGTVTTTGGAATATGVTGGTGTAPVGPAGASLPAGSTGAVGAISSASAATGPADGAVAVAGQGASALGTLLAGEEATTEAARAVPVKAVRAAPSCRLIGGVRPAPDGAAGRLQRKVGDRWTTVRRVALKDGGFETVVPKQGSWRVRVGRVSTPVAGL